MKPKGPRIGVGFEYPRVLNGAMHRDWRGRWDLLKRMTRMPRDGKPRPAWGILAPSAVEMSRRLYWKD